MAIRSESMMHPATMKGLMMIRNCWYRKLITSFWLNNLSRAAPLYARAEKLFADKGDARDEIYAKVGRLRLDAETMAFDEPSHAGDGTQVTRPIVPSHEPSRS